MTGEIPRLRSFRHYGRGHPRGQHHDGPACFHSADAKAQPGKHIIVVAIAQVPDSMELTDEFVTARMTALGWKRIEEDDGEG